MEGQVKLIAKNRKASWDYQIVDTFECGMVLEGSEVKAVKAGGVSFADSFAVVENGEVFVQNLRISEYSFSSLFGHEPMRKKKLLLHKDEIRRLARKSDIKGFTLVPLEVYLKKGLVKLRLGLCKGKKEVDKRATLKERDVKREIQREFKNRVGS